MRNPLDSPNFWLAMVLLLTGFAFLTYSGPKLPMTGAAVGTSLTHEEVEKRDVMEFSESAVMPIIIDDIVIDGEDEAK